MKIDKYGQQIFTEKDICDYFYQNPDIKIVNCLVDKLPVFDTDLELNNIPELIQYAETNLSQTEFDTINQQTWFISEEYKNFDIAKWLLDQCKTDAEIQRVGQELLLYAERQLLDLLKYLKYLTDTMRKNNIVWGVGRGSSVSSYILYLLNIHRINSLYYDLDINDFLRKEV